MTYQDGKAKAIEEAMEWQQTFADGKSYYWSEIFEFSVHFTKLAKRYGLVREFRENGII